MDSGRLGQASDDEVAGLIGAADRAEAAACFLKHAAVAETRQAADQRITWWARQLRAAGIAGGMDVLRARAALDLLLDTDSRPPAARGTAPAGTGAEHPGGPT